MAMYVADHIPRRLRAWGVEHVFGYPGDGSNVWWASGTTAISTR